MRSLGSMAVAILKTADARKKAVAAGRAAALWRDGHLAHRFEKPVPVRPGRPAEPRLLPPGRMPKRGKGTSRARRIALLHAIAHIELNAIDLAWDIVARFGLDMPRAFADDWVGVGEDEARHFLMLDDRLHQLGAHYGSLPAHDGLWQSAQATSARLDARLAVVPMVLEARGLDVSPQMIARLNDQGDTVSADLLSVILEDEKSHVRAGSRWFAYVCDRQKLDRKAHFQALVRQYFTGRLKAPFNRPAREEAGLPWDFYAPLADG